MEQAPIATPARTLTESRLRVIRQYIVGALGVIAVFYAVFSVALATQFYSTPFLGFFITGHGTVNGGRPSGEANWTGLNLGMQRGDAIVRINSLNIVPDPMSQAVDLSVVFESLRQAGFNQPVQVVFQRATTEAPSNVGVCEQINAVTAECTLTIATMRLPDGDFLSFFAIPFISGLVLIFIGGLVFYYRNTRIDGLTIAATSFLTSIFTIGLFEIDSTTRTTVLWIMAAGLLGGMMTTLALSFPTRSRMLRYTPSLLLIPIALGLLVAAAIIILYLNPIDRFDYRYPQATILFVILSMVVCGGLFAFVQRPRSLTLAARRQTDIALIGITLLLVPGVLYIPYDLFIGNTLATAPISFESFMPLFIFPNAGFAFALLQYRRLDTDRLISQSLTYGIMLVALVVGTFLLSLGGTLIAVDLLNASNFASIGLILFVMVMLFTPVRTRIQNRIDELYYRTRRNYTEKVEEFGQTLVSSSRYEDVVSEYRKLISENIAPTNIFVFVRARETGDYVAFNNDTEVRFVAESPLVAALIRSRDTLVFSPDEPIPLALYTEQARLRLLRAITIAPMKSADDLIGFVVIAPPKSEKLGYNYEELRFFTSLTNQLAIGTERTQVIGSLEQRVRELDVLSQVGQAVNFTIEFDDLLELINAQTTRLVDAPCFYIALYNESLNQMSFAFFLEGDDRETKKENKRWLLDNGLFSEVVRTNTTIRVDNYVYEMEKRAAKVLLETPMLRAWMGVPLAAGRRILGVLAVGKTNSDTFTDEQFKIFGDIGALAATSIDKARLFAETRARERQLTVLNDISRQLVATESDVEKLLQIIMSSAVDILNCEAGSLLLMAEDDSSMLEFRVVIGGAEHLLKTRIDAKKGIAGSVVKTGKALIVNDAGESKQNQIVTESYKTQSLLAVPLIAKNDVIGVLEVLNKTDGTGFVQEDSDLLTAFAGQAAVAIENARLFRMTDLQLAQRVKELEALERIDNDLNRTLDVQEVAMLTVRAAMQVLNAQAGALGIVEDLPPRLEIVGLEGYEPEDYPKGAEGLMWSLDSGIIKRVMRSRQPDLAPDVSIDPAYTQGLRGSLSQITLPMSSGNEINAILILEKSQMPRFNLSDWAFAQRLAEHASIAIANAQLYAALTQANKSKSEFMGFAAHELKNPLTSVIGFADLLRQGMTGSLTDQQQGLVNIIHSNANRMQTIIQDLRDSARMDANEFSVELAPMNLRHAVIETLRPFVQFMRDKNQELVNLIGDDMPLVLGDENRLIQVLTNLVSNAHKYSPANTTITIRAEVLTNFVDHAGKRREPMLRLSVVDEGLGISEEDQERLFKERYFRSTNQLALEQPGTGLGMTLTFGIIQKHNGDIWVESELGKGSAFHIAIPLAPQAVKTRVNEPASD